MENKMALEGPVLKVNGELLLLIPLEDGGAGFADFARGISETHGEFLKIVIPEWLAGILQIEEGDLVRVSNDGGLHISPVSPRLVH